MAEKRVWDKMNQWAEEIDLLKSIIAQTGLAETVKWGGPVFTANNKNIVGVGGFKSYVGIWFFNGAFLKDEAGKLINAQEGVTKALRQWRFTSKEEIRKNDKLILQYILEAIDNEKAGLSAKPEKKALITSELLQKELEGNPELAAAFAAFPPYKQREFLEYIETAKREETRIARMQKIRPMILSHIGLNDKYK